MPKVPKQPAKPAGKPGAKQASIFERAAAPIQAPARDTPLLIIRSPEYLQSNQVVEAEANEAETRELRERAAALESKIAELTSALQQKDNLINQAESRAKNLEGQISHHKDEMGEMNKRLMEANTTIKTKEAELNQAKSTTLVEQNRAKKLQEELTAARAKITDGQQVQISASQSSAWAREVSRYQALVDSLEDLVEEGARRLADANQAREAATEALARVINEKSEILQRFDRLRAQVATPVAASPELQAQLDESKKFNQWLSEENSRLKAQLAEFEAKGAK